MLFGGLLAALTRISVRLHGMGALNAFLLPLVLSTTRFAAGLAGMPVHSIPLTATVPLPRHVKRCILDVLPIKSGRPPSATLPATVSGRQGHQKRR